MEEDNRRMVDETMKRSNVERSPSLEADGYSDSSVKPCSSSRSFSTSPPAACTACRATSLIRRRRSAASFSRRAFVLLEPLGATPVMSTFLSYGVKLTKSTPPRLMPPPPPPTLLLRLLMPLPPPAIGPIEPTTPMVVPTAPPPPPAKDPKLADVERRAGVFGVVREFCCCCCCCCSRCCCCLHHDFFFRTAEIDAERWRTAELGVDVGDGDSSWSVGLLVLRCMLGFLGDERPP